MNNSAFRNLASAGKTNVEPPSKQGQHGTVKQAGISLGSRARSFIPMTPRTVPGHRQNVHSEFAHQVANATFSPRSIGDEGPPLKKFKASAAPKGTKLASGYTDRASLLRTGGGEDAGVEDKEKRLKALEEMFKLQQIDQDTFERLKSDIGVGGDVSSTHLVRGLDWKLLERVRRGEDVTKATASEDIEILHTDADVDMEFDKALEKEVLAKADTQDTEPVSDDNSDATGAQDNNSRTMTRDEILHRLKQSRKTSMLDVPSTSTPQAPLLNDKFKKIQSSPNGPKKEKFTETVNGRKREVLLITNADGSTKRKTRWLEPEPSSDRSGEHVDVTQERSSSTKPEVKEKRSKKQGHDVLGMEVPAEIAAREAARKIVEEATAAEDDDDIFQGLGDDYDPLADVRSDASDTEEVQSKPTMKPEIENSLDTTEGTNPTMRKRNYFGSSSTTENDTETTTNTIMKDPNILAALKRAAEIRKREEHQDNPEDPRYHDNSDSGGKSHAFLAKLRDQERQDAADLDMSFGGSRFDEDDEGDGADLYSFDHEGGGDEDEGHTSKKRKEGRKRGPKKKKGDKNNFADVMGVIEGRKKA